MVKLAAPLPPSPGPSTPRPIASLTAVLLFLLIAAGCTGSPKTGDPSELAGEYPIPQQPALVAQGFGLYANNCAHCHGTGTEPPLTENTPTHSSSGHTWHHPDQFLASWILDGIPGAFTMPRFRGQLSENEVRAVIAYIKTFWTEVERQQQQAMSANFEASYR